MGPRASYGERLKDPRWQKKRLAILERDEWTCQRCHDTTSTLNVHHRFYAKSGNPWDVPDSALLTLCENCHQYEAEARPPYEAGLLRVLREQFLADDLYPLIAGFDAMCQLHIAGVVAAAIGDMLEDPDGQQIMLDRYFQKLEARRSAAKGDADGALSQDRPTLLEG